MILELRIETDDTKLKLFEICETTAHSDNCNFFLN